MEELPIWKQELPATPHKLLNNLVKVLVEFYGEHLRRDRADGRLQPGKAWDLLRGFLIAAMQTYASICILLAEKRPKRLMLQADVLNRALFEILATVFAILEDPGPRAGMLLRESHKAHATRYRYLNSRWGGDPQWAEYLDVYRKGLPIIGKEISLAPEDALRPEAIADEWPTPGVMIYGRPSRDVPPFVSGARLDVLRATYQYHYPHQSAQAHGRIATLAVALLVDDPNLSMESGVRGKPHRLDSALVPRVHPVGAGGCWRLSTSSQAGRALDVSARHRRRGEGSLDAALRSTSCAQDVNRTCVPSVRGLAG